MTTPTSGDQAYFIGTWYPDNISLIVCTMRQLVRMRLKNSFKHLIDEHNRIIDKFFHSFLAVYLPVANLFLAFAISDGKKSDAIAIMSNVTLMGLVKKIE